MPRVFVGLGEGIGNVTPSCDDPRALARAWPRLIRVVGPRAGGFAVSRRSRPPRHGRRPMPRLYGNECDCHEKNHVEIVGNVALVRLTQGKTAHIDADDVWLVEGLRWRAKCIQGMWYAYGCAREHGRKTDVSMHRLIAGAPKGRLVDHEDGDGLNNRRGNLRLCNHQQNAMNRRGRRGTDSGFKGVYLNHAQHKPWTAVIRIGSYETAEEAARAYDLWAAKIHGAFARPNLPKESP